MNTSYFHNPELRHNLEFVSTLFREQCQLVVKDYANSIINDAGEIRKRPSSEAKDIVRDLEDSDEEIYRCNEKLQALTEEYQDFSYGLLKSEYSFEDEVESLIEKEDYTEILYRVKSNGHIYKAKAKQKSKQIKDALLYFVKHPVPLFLLIMGIWLLFSPSVPTETTVMEIAPKTFLEYEIPIVHKRIERIAPDDILNAKVPIPMAEKVNKIKNISGAIMLLLTMLQLYIGLVDKRKINALEYKTEVENALDKSVNKSLQEALDELELQIDDMEKIMLKKIDINKYEL